jgi:hypothetical protein
MEKGPPGRPHNFSQRRNKVQFGKSCFEFEVKSLDEVQVLLRTWNRVLAHHRPKEAQGAPRLSEEHLVNIGLDDRQRPEEVVILQFLAPPDLLDRLVADLKDNGFACRVIKAIKGLWTRYRLHVNQH